ncbi:MAG: hypothetical protein AAFN27_12920 [Pseudomonadota bacterium]
MRKRKVDEIDPNNIIDQERTRKKPTPSGSFATETSIKAIDPNIDVLAVTRTQDDLDWLPVEPGRPSPFPTTWSQTYAGLVPVKDPSGTVTGFKLKCQEGCASWIHMDGKYCELGETTAPNRRLQKPPVCHDTPWVAIREMLNARENGKKFTEDFRRHACWHQSNLRPGHSTCNSSGQKAMASNLTGPEKSAANSLINRVIKEFNGKNIWK